MGKILRASVMRSSEWFKDRDEKVWKIVRTQVLRRDNYTCVYCGWQSRRFMQVNHIGAEDDHGAVNLETVCKPCHSVLHLGLSSMRGTLTAFECVPELTDMVTMVRATRAHVAKGTPWPEIEKRALARFCVPGGRIYTSEETRDIANEMLRSIPAGEYRGYLAEGLAVLFHESEPWNGYSERVSMWQLPD